MRGAMQHPRSASVWRQALCLALAALLAVSLAVRPVFALEAMLNEPQRTNYRAYGWLFLVATLGAFAVAANDFDESKKSLDQSKQSYTQYQAATTPAQAQALHDQTQGQLNRAQSYESTANAAVFLGIAFALATIYSFKSGDQPQGPILLSANSVGWQIRF